ncbi:hypothetical protein SAMN05421753_105243 [Planctomicrobium piriforme]|uniref:Uncharacterized protein n=1 Tax=Planctomicrobium piriforme TaxID=1576369 RepID=A0A1I3FGV9_9PLAN|nr:hypothetical protein SAMN05421753_105243 [Planctomicrobium piriforme]
MFRIRLRIPTSKKLIALKGLDRLAQGNALGNATRNTIQPCKGATTHCLCRALSGLVVHHILYSQGVALGYVVIALSGRVHCMTTDAR